MEFLVLDFEKACQDPWSICQIGLVEYKNSEITVLIDEYVNPKCEFDKESRYFTNLHGISENEVAEALTFDKLYPKLKDLIEDKTVYNHNGSDEKFFKEACKKHKLDIFNVKWVNSLPIARDTWHNIGNHGVENLAKYLNIKYTPHNAAQDSIATAKILAIASIINDSPNNYKSNTRANNNELFKTPRGNRFSTKITGELLKPLNSAEVLNKKTPFYNKKVVVSGTYSKWPDRKDLAQILKDHGADIDSKIGPNTDFLCAGKGVGPKKIKDMKNKINEGRGGQIIEEDKILEFLNIQK